MAYIYQFSGQVVSCLAAFTNLSFHLVESIPPSGIGQMLSFCPL